VIRIERGKTAAISQSFYVDGVLTNATAGVTVTATRADGTALATNAATTNSATGVYTYNLAAQSNLDLLTLVYTGTWGGAVQTETQKVEIVGDFYLTLDELRKLDARFAATATPLIAIADLRRVLAEVEDAIEAETGVAFVNRYARETLDGNGSTYLLLNRIAPRTILSARTYTSASAFTAFTSAELADLRYESFGRVGRWSLGVWPLGSRNIVVEYEHGYDSPPPLITRAARALFKLKMIEDLATTDPSLTNVRSLSVEGYSVSYANTSATGSTVADDYINQWKRSTTAGGVAIA